MRKLVLSLGLVIVLAAGAWAVIGSSPGGSAEATTATETTDAALAGEGGVFSNMAGGSGQTPPACSANCATAAAGNCPSMAQAASSKADCAENCATVCSGACSEACKGSQNCSAECLEKCKQAAACSQECKTKCASQKSCSGSCSDKSAAQSGCTRHNNSSGK